MAISQKGEDEMERDNQKGKQKWQGPRVKPMLQPISISEKEAKVKITLLNTWQKRWVRVELEDVVPLDGIFEVEREKEYTAKIPKGTTSLHIKVTDVQSGIWDVITVPIPTPEKKTAEKPKEPVEIIGPCGKQKVFYVTVRTKEAHAPVNFSSNEELTVKAVDPKDGPNTGTHFELETGDEASLVMMISFTDTERKAILIFRVDGQTSKRMLIK